MRKKSEKGKGGFSECMNECFLERRGPARRAGQAGWLDDTGTVAFTETKPLLSKCHIVFFKV